MCIENIGLLCSWLRSQWTFKISNNVCPHNMLWTAESFITKLSMILHHPKPEWHEKGEGSYNQMWLFTVSSELMILLQPDIVWW